MSYSKADQDDLQQSQDVRSVDIVTKLPEQSYFISVGSNGNQDRLFLGTYGGSGSAVPNLGTVYELLPYDECYRHNNYPNNRSNRYSNDQSGNYCEECRCYH